MIRRATSASVLLLSVFALNLHAAAIGNVIAVQGKASATSVDGKARILRLKSPISMQDRIVTQGNTRLQIMFVDDSIISLGPSSEMTIDEYIYSPKNKKKSGSTFGFVRGIFRVVTGKITELNPDRFKVKTRMATIGIRGCELGFRIRLEQEDIYVLELPTGREIVIRGVNQGGQGTGQEWNQGLHRGWVMKGQVLRVLKQGVRVSIKEGAGMEGMDISPDEARQWIEGVTPDKIGHDDEEEVPPRDEFSPGEMKKRIRAAKIFIQDKTKEESADDEEAEARQVHNSAIREAIESRDLDKLRALLEDPLTTDEERHVIRSVIHRLSIDAAISGADIGLLILLLNDPMTTEEQRHAILGRIADLEAPTELLIASGNGANWQWGMWDSGRINIDGMFVSAADFTAITGGAMLYNLSGSGSAGALVRHGGVTKRLSGLSSLNVVVGMGVTPTWDGMFNLGNAVGDSLSFAADGTIGTTVLADGRAVNQFTGYRRGYSLSVNGSLFDGASITGHSIKGHLVGPGTGTDPITGAVGKFHFEHGAAATVDGAFGANLN